jgi:hypothetical protein
MQDPSPSRRHRLPTRLSVRALMIFVLTPGGGFGWVVNRAHTQRDAVEVIRRAGARAGAARTGGVGGVMYDWQFANGACDGKGTPWWPAWLMDRIGVDYFGHVTWVFLPELSDVETVHIGHLAQLERLDLIGPSMTDARLADLKGLTRLESMSLKDAAITDAGLDHLKGMTRLKDLFLGGTKVTDAGVRGLQQALPKLSIER